MNKSRPKQVMFRLSEEAKELQKKIEKSGISQQLADDYNAEYED